MFDDGLNLTMFNTFDGPAPTRHVARDTGARQTTSTTPTQHTIHQFFHCTEPVVNLPALLASTKNE